MPLTDTTTITLAIADTVKQITQLVVISNFILNMLLSASLNHLWSMVNTQ